MTICLCRVNVLIKRVLEAVGSFTLFLRCDWCPPKARCAVIETIEQLAWSSQKPTVSRHYSIKLSILCLLGWWCIHLANLFPEAKLTLPRWCALVPPAWCQQWLRGNFGRVWGPFLICVLCMPYAFQLDNPDDCDRFQ